jgi:hypothetical protein
MTWGSGGTTQPFLTLALVGGEWSASLHGTHWIGGRVGPRAGLDAMEKRKILPYRGSNPGCPAHSLLLYHLSYPNSIFACCINKISRLYIY